MKSYKLILQDEAQTQALGRIFASHIQRGIVFLQGELGAGKTTFAQAWIRSMGFSGRVKSPTYTLLEPYELDDVNIYHFDLYRLQDEEELLFLGCDDYFEAASNTDKQHKNTVCLIEWPEKAMGVLPSADIELRIQHHQEQLRNVEIYCHSLFGEQILNAMEAELQNLN